jgi:hypothetical protein
MEIKQSLPPHRLCTSTYETTSEPLVTAHILIENLIAQYSCLFLLRLEFLAKTGVPTTKQAYLKEFSHTTVDIGGRKRRRISDSTRDTFAQEASCLLFIETINSLSQAINNFTRCILKTKEEKDKEP